MSDNFGGSEIKDRILRVTAALYRVTDLFQDEEPLKWSLRRDAVAIVDSVPDEFERSKVEQIADGLEETTCLIQGMAKKLLLAQAGGFVSRFNFDVLGREYQIIFEKIRLAKASFEEGSNILETLPLPLKQAEATPPQSSSVRNRASIPSFPASDLQKKAGRRNAAGRQNLKDKSSSLEGDASLSERQKSIIQFMKSGDSLSASAFMPLFGGEFSEKTVQRDLNGLVTKGFLVFNGEKRWRKYSLALSPKVASEFSVNEPPSDTLLAKSAKTGAAVLETSGLDDKETKTEEAEGFGGTESWI